VVAAYIKEGAVVTEVILEAVEVVIDAIDGAEPQDKV
jgi:hypothetical protein